jgi:hypothetical protein
VAWSVANHDLAMLESPQMLYREQWLYDLAACHWSDADSKLGLIYQKFLKFICCFITGNFEEQSIYSFKVFQNDETKLIEKSRMQEFLRSCLQVDKTLSEYLDEKALDEIVKNSFEKMNLVEDETIGLEQYKKFLEKYPNILNAPNPISRMMGGTPTQEPVGGTPVMSDTRVGVRKSRA